MEGFRRALVLGLVLIAGTAIEQAHSVVIHIMYVLHLRVTSFKNVEPIKNKCVRWKCGTIIRNGTA